MNFSRSSVLPYIDIDITWGEVKTQVLLVKWYLLLQFFLHLLRLFLPMTSLIKCSSLTPRDAVLDDIVRLSRPTPERTITIYTSFGFHRPLYRSIPSHSPFSLPPFSASAWKIAVVCNDVLPTSSLSSFLASSSHSPASSPQSLVFFIYQRGEKNMVPVPLSSPLVPHATKENHFH